MPESSGETPGASKADQFETAVRRAIRLIPRGKVASYGQVAAAAGYPQYHRQVARLLRKSVGTLPWHRVLGSGGQIKTEGGDAVEQRLRLEKEGVRFQGSRVDMRKHQSVFHLEVAKEAQLQRRKRLMR